MSGPIRDLVTPKRPPLERLAELGDVAKELAILCVAWASRVEGPNPEEPRSVFVAAYGAIGDTILFLPALEALRKTWPKARVTFMTDPWAEEFLPATGLADEWWFYKYLDLWKASTRREVSTRIRFAGFDAAVVGQGTPLRGLGPGLMAVPARAGHCRPVQAPHAGWSPVRYAGWRLHRLLARQELERRIAFNRKVWVGVDDEHTVSRNLRLVAAIGASTPPVERSRPELSIPEEAIRFADRVLPAASAPRTLGLHVGAPYSAYAKIWPPERWGEALRAIEKKARCRVVILGGKDEADAARRVAAAYGRDCVDLAGRAKLWESFACIRRCDLFLSNDTGLSKAAMALGVPTVAVWGPSDRPGYGVAWDRERHTEVHRVMPCAPCVRMGLPQEGDGVLNFSNCGHHDCLNRLEPAAVAEAALKRL